MWVPEQPRVNLWQNVFSGLGIEVDVNFMKVIDRAQNIMADKIGQGAFNDVNDEAQNRLQNLSEQMV
jgi:hypothetical protein